MKIMKNMNGRWMGGWLVASVAAFALLVGSVTAAPKDAACCAKKCSTCACCKDCKACDGCGKQTADGKKASCCENCKCADTACCPTKKADCPSGKKGCEK